jgi:hypothetical protein
MDHSCTARGATCDQTLITLQSPNNVWAAGVYTLALNIDGTMEQCTLQISDPPPENSIQGTCSLAGTTLSLEQICVEPAAVCHNNTCERPPANCLAGQFQMQVVASPAGGPDAQPHVAAQVGLDLSVDGRSVTSVTIAPKATTTEPNGAGCGTCTNASTTIPIAGG